MLPFDAESTEALEARFAAAFEGVYDADEIRRGDVKRPGQQRRHVFDFEDGMRMIVSRERMGAECVVHVSASLTEDSPLLPGIGSLGEIVQKAQLRFQGMVDRDLVHRNTAVTGGGVIHFLYADPGNLFAEEA